MKKILVLLADGFEDIEALASIDLWRRGGLQVDLVGVNGYEVKTGLGTSVNTNMLLDSVEKETYDLLFLPGGGGVQILDDSVEVKELVKWFDKQGKLIAAICAAPLILGKLGILDNRVFTCYPSFERFAPEGKYKITGVIQDGHIITGRGVAYVFDFALYILEVLQGKDTRLKIEEGTLILESKKGLE